MGTASKIAKAKANLSTGEPCSTWSDDGDCAGDTAEGKVPMAHPVGNGKCFECHKQIMRKLCTSIAAPEDAS